MIGPAAHLSVVVASAVVVGTFGAAGGAGSWLAAQQHSQGVTGAEADLHTADHVFQQQLKLSLV